ncbi:hypothetical protein BO226_04740 [Rhodococcus sp. 2G]|uniref:tyrosine-type recombinase/integrase n=1 Tax=Rhodococcus sp. 2G TaxID=1570939 RepID=UPI0009031F51|nr:tyrosine-type recombinase/integrase [Rhodococcus sp. 2G]APE08614.1 hypothetical protein BO226_04740 [Rhodococcus sp. 2G]
MPRQPLPIGHYGNIATKQLADSANGQARWRASARYRDHDGTTRTIQAIGTSKANAIQRLKNSITDRTTQNAGDITPDTRLHELAKLWIDELTIENRVSIQTIQAYRDEIGPATTGTDTITIIDGIGNLRVREATTSRIDRFLKGIATNHPSKARRIKAILSGMLGMAARHDAIATNPVRETASIRRGKADPRALTLDELQALRSRVRLWMTGAQMPEDKKPRQKGGQQRNQQLLDVVDVLLATGARIGEVLALRWADVDLAASPPRATIAGTVVRVDGQGLKRQEFPKSKKPRIVLLPKFAVDTLMRLKMNATPNEHDVIFPSDRGTLRDPHNLRRQWRDARGQEWAWVTPHSFRRTVATLVDREYGSKEAAAQLGHSGTAVTEKHYIAKAEEAPDLTAVLNRLGGRQ